MAEPTHAALRPFVDRERELETLLALADNARIGRGALVLLGGAPGVGRTRLVEQLGERAASRGLRALWSRWRPEDDAAVLARWEPILREAGGGDDADRSSVRRAGTAADRLALFDRTVRLLGRRAREQPLVAVIDDFDAAADTASLRFLEHLAPELPALPILVVAICATAPASLADHAHPLQLSGLDAEAVGALLVATTGQPCDPALTAAVHRVTEGNPLLVTEVAADPSRITEDGFTAETILTGALRGLPAASRRALAAAGVLGEEFDVALLAAITDHDGAGIDWALATAQGAGIVAPTGLDTTRWAFSHTMWQQASQQDMTPGEAADLHLRAALALEKSYGAEAPDHAAQLACHHLGAVGATDPRDAARWAEQAGHNALGQLAWEDAAIYYRAALDVDGMGDDDRARLLPALGRALLAAGSTDAARVTFDEAAALARGHDRPDDLARVALDLSAPAAGLEPNPVAPAALALLEESLASVGRGALRAQVGARLSLVLGSEEAGRREQLGAEAVALARQVHDGPALVAALVSRCAVLAGPTHRHSRLDAADEIVTLAQRARDLESELIGRRTRIVALLEGRLVGTADAEIAAFASVTDGLAQPRLSWRVALWRATVALLQGRFAECERRNHEALTLGRRARSSRAEALATVQFFGLRVAQDRIVELEAPARVLADHPEERADSGATHVCLLGLLGRDGEACHELARLAADRFATIGDDDRRLAALALLAEQAATLDQRPEAAVLYKLLAPYARCFAVEAMASVCHGSVSRHLGLLAHTLHRWDEADAHFRNALEDNEGAGAPLLAAHTRSQWSALLRTRDVEGDWERGLELLSGAESIYRRLEVERLADEARQILARSHEPPARERSGSGNAFRQEVDGWFLSYGGVEARVPDSLGMHDLAAFLANPGRSFHVTDLATGVFPHGVGRAGQRPRPPTNTPGRGRDALDLEALTRAEYHARLGELDHIDATGDPVRVSLARAERDFIEGELGPEGSAGQDAGTDPTERARRTVATRIRLSFDRIDAAHPALGRHLRHSVHTGTFCSYEPEIQTSWPPAGSGD